MSDATFHTSAAYKEKQSKKAKEAWQARLLRFEFKRDVRACARSGCKNTFTVTPSSPKRYCSRGCSAEVSNRVRGAHAEQTRARIAQSMKGKISPFKGAIKVPRVAIVCANPDCGKEMLTERWKKTKYCSNACLMHVVGGRPTSPKASRGKAGIREDISSTIYFHSTWEANIARLYNHLGIKWEYEPKTFDIGTQNYTPDFYLPETDAYIEVKNFWWSYSVERDRKFREKYPTTVLRVILKDEYLTLEKQYATLIPAWEYRHTGKGRSRREL